MRKDRAAALMVLGSPLIGIHRRRILDLAAKSRLPAIYTVRENPDAGGLMSYGANFHELWRRAAAYVDKIGSSAYRVGDFAYFRSAQAYKVRIFRRKYSSSCRP